jgi:2-oxoglutarate ferredoxin oxidoreductase subunit gamma
MTHEIISSGFGGQGVLFIGKILATAGMIEGKEVSWIPSYGPEMRGGTANCSVVISDQRIGAPVVNHPTVLIAMNRPSLEKFAAETKAKGCIIYNKSLIEVDPNRSDLEVAAVRATEIADEVGNTKLANIVALGALIAKVPVVSKESVISALKKTLTGKKEQFLKANIEALEKGMSAA